MAATAATSTSAYDVAIIGGGIAGCAAARSVGLHDPHGRASVTVYEIGRGPGGRASTRRTRAIPDLRINHGAPYADIRTEEGRRLVADLKLAEFVGRWGTIDPSTGVFTGGDDGGGGAEEAVFVTGGNNEMSDIASSLLSTPPTTKNPIGTRYSSMVRSLSRTESRWHLHDKSGTTLGSADYLIVAGSGIAHPRWTDTFGGPPPLLAAADELDSPVLHRALASIAGQTADPVLALFFYREGEEAARWRDVGFHVGEVTGGGDGGKEGVLSKIIVQPNGADGCAVVLHSTVGFARSNGGVYGSSSSAARVGGVSSDQTAEDRIIGAMLAALADIPGMPEVEAADDGGYGPLLHRWGNAFPTGKALEDGLVLCEKEGVGFCGDYTETRARMGSVEAALLSGTSIGERIAKLASGVALQE